MSEAIVASTPSPPTLRLERVFAADSLALRGRALGRLRGLDWSLGRGLHGVVGAPADGTAALASVLSGAIRPSAGACLIEGGEPSGSAAVRRKIASLEPRPTLVGRTVRGWHERAAALRGDGAGARERLEAFGVGALLDRSPRSLSMPEARAVELAFVLAHPSPTLTVLYEPWSSVASFDSEAVRRALVERAAESCVVLIVSTLDDVATLADDVWLLERGLFRGVDGGPGWTGRHAATLSVLIEDSCRTAAPKLVGELSRCLPEAREIGWSAAAPDLALRRVTLTCDDVAEAARVVTEVVASGGYEVVAVEAPPRLPADVATRGGLRAERGAR